MFDIIKRSHNKTPSYDEINKANLFLLLQPASISENLTKWSSFPYVTRRKNAGENRRSRKGIQQKVKSGNGTLYDIVNR